METFYISKVSGNTDYLVRLFKQVFQIILVFHDALRTPIYSSEEYLINHVKCRQVYTNITCTSIELIML